MIPYGGPVICADCRTLAHEPRPDCPAPALGAYPDARETEPCATA